MATVGIYDADFFKYNSVIPNLECAKLFSYYSNKMRDLTVLTPYLQPDKYSKFFIRKEYNDGKYPKKYFEPNCVYGGRAFNPERYVPLPREIEEQIPNIRAYESFAPYFGTSTLYKTIFKKLMYGAHLRLSTDGKHLNDMDSLYRQLRSGEHHCIILHDYNLTDIDGVYDALYELSQDYILTNKRREPYKIGNKFPFIIRSAQEFEQLTKLVPSPDVFNLQYSGVMDDETVYALCTRNLPMAKKLSYYIGSTSSDEKQFLEQDLPKIYRQVTFFRNRNIRILLKYDGQKIVTPELQKFVDTLQYWINTTYFSNFLEGTQTLYTFCKCFSRFKKMESFDYHRYNFPDLKVDDLRTGFQYIRENNYELFKKLYEEEIPIYKGGEIKWKE